MDTDAIILQTGGCGLSQVLLVIAIYSVNVLAAWGTTFMAFGNYNPGWTCSNYTSFLSITSANLSVETAINATGIITTTRGLVIRSLDIAKDGMAISTTPGILTASKNTPSEDQCNHINVCAMIKFNEDSSTIVTEWGLVCEATWITSLIISTQQAGSFLGSLMAGYLADLKGRKVGLYLFSVLSCVVHVVGVFSVSWQMFAVVRFFIGVCNGGIKAIDYPYAQEFANSKWRSYLSAVPDYSLGSVSFALTAGLLKNWRHIHIATAVMALVFTVPAIWVPESMRWLAVNGKPEKAKSVIKKISKMNGKPLPNTDFLDEIAREGQEHNKDNTSYTYKHIYGKSLRRQTITFAIIYFLLSMSWFAMSFGIKSLSGNFYLNLAIFALPTIPAYLPMSWVANRFGRKIGVICFLIPASGMCFAITVVFFVVPHSIGGHVITALVVLISVCVDVAWMCGTLLVVESYPTVVRALGYSSSVMWARLGSILAPFLVPKSYDYVYISYLVIGSAMILCCGLFMSLPETRGQSLKDTIELRIQDGNVPSTSKNDANVDMNCPASEALVKV